MARRGERQKKRAGVRGTSRPSDPETRERQRAFVTTVARLADPLCTAEGMEMVHVEYQREPGGLTLRLYLDKSGGVSLDDCVDISRQLEDILDVHAPDAPPYRLEVSSPGLDRPVGKMADFIRFKGLPSKIRVATAVNGQKNFTGVLDGVEGEQIRIQVNNETVSLDFKNITRARLINFNGER
ncbi:MAG: ribosome maturation factor RimP [Desulfosarcina sp.]